MPASADMEEPWVTSLPRPPGRSACEPLKTQAKNPHSRQSRKVAQLPPQFIKFHFIVLPSVVGFLRYLEWKFFARQNLALNRGVPSHKIPFAVPAKKTSSPGYSPLRDVSPSGVINEFTVFDK